MRTPLYSFLLSLIFVAPSFAQPQNKVEEKKAKLICDEILKLKDLASKKFEGLAGEKEQAKQLNSDSYLSKQSFGIEGSTRIVIYHHKKNNIVHDSPSMEFTMHFGVDSQNSQLTYLTLIVELDNCLKRVGFDKEVEIKRGRDPLTDRIKETSKYVNTEQHVVFTVTLLDPQASEIKDGKPANYSPSELVTVSVKNF